MHQPFTLRLGHRRLYGRLMGTNGPNLRRLYLPGLDALKVELACFDWLLVAKQPELQRHLHVSRVEPPCGGGHVGGTCCWC